MSDHYFDSFFDIWTRARSTDPGTSFEAAEKIAPKMTRIQAQVLNYFRTIYPRSITDLDLQDHFGNQLSTYRTRRSELTAMDLVLDSGMRRFQHGSNRVLWIAKPWM